MGNEPSRLCHITGLWGIKEGNGEVHGAACDAGGTGNNSYLLIKNCVEMKHSLDTMDPCFVPLAADIDMSNHQG